MTKKIKDIVTIICYGKKEKMERDKAIKKYTECIQCSEGSEQGRYANILGDLLSGCTICSDEY